jgi:pimeloyl-ACP methyl ester carboxylesterase
MHRAFGPLRVYPTQQAAIAQFRTVPDQPSLPYIAEHIARTSIRPVDGGWSWKFDPRIFQGSIPTVEALSPPRCRVAMFRAEFGLVSSDMGELISDRLGRVTPIIELPGAGHAPMVDQPLGLVAALRTLLGAWDHSVPARAAVIRPESGSGG